VIEFSSPVVSPTLVHIPTARAPYVDFALRSFHEIPRVERVTRSRGVWEHCVHGAGM